MARQGRATNALQRSRPDPERLVRRVLEETGEARKLAGGGLGTLLSKAEGLARLDAVTVEDDGAYVDDTNLYPTLDDPNFNVKLSEKREFFDTRFFQA